MQRVLKEAFFSLYFQVLRLFAAQGVSISPNRQPDPIVSSSILLPLQHSNHPLYLLLKPSDTLSTPPTRFCVTRHFNMFAPDPPFPPIIPAPLAPSFLQGFTWTTPPHRSYPCRGLPQLLPHKAITRIVKNLVDRLVISSGSPCGQQSPSVGYISCSLFHSCVPHLHSIVFNSYSRTTHLGVLRLIPSLPSQHAPPPLPHPFQNK